MGLDLHAFLWSHKNFMTVYVGGKGYPLFPDVAQLGQRKNLKPTAVRQNGAIPPGKAVKPSQLLDDFISGTKMKMVGVAKLHLAFQLPKIQSGYRALDRTRRRHIHKRGHLNHAMRRMEFTSAG